MAAKGFADAKKVRLNFGAKILTDDLEIVDYDIKEGSTIFALRLALRRGRSGKKNNKVSSRIETEDKKEVLEQIEKEAKGMYINEKVLNRQRADFAKTKGKLRRANNRNFRSFNK